MDLLLSYGITACLICFAIGNFFLTRIPFEYLPDHYMVKNDPLVYLLPLFLLSGLAIYFLCPVDFDQINQYSVWQFVLPSLFAFMIYIVYLVGFDVFANILTFSFALIFVYLQPDNFLPFFPYLSPIANKFALAFILYLISVGLGILDGMGGISSLQFFSVMAVAIILTYYGLFPQLLGIIALAYLGIILSFLFLSWPPEKLLITTGGFSAIGFILGCFILQGAVELAGPSLLVASSYLFTECGIAFYNRYICNKKEPFVFMNTSYFMMMKDGEFEEETAQGILKILIIDIILAVVQANAQSPIAFIYFSIALNLWFLSVLAGNTTPYKFQFFSGFGKKAFHVVFKKKDKKKD